MTATTQFFGSVEMARVIADQFQGLAPSLSEAGEEAHMGHPDLRVRAGFSQHLGPKELGSAQRYGRRVSQPAIYGPSPTSKSDFIACGESGATKLYP